MHDHVSATEFRLLNKEGKLCAVLSAVYGTPTFQLYDSNGLQRVTIEVDQFNRPKVILLAEDGKSIAGMGTAADGSGGISVADGSGDTGMMIWNEPDGEWKITPYKKD